MNPEFAEFLGDFAGGLLSEVRVCFFAKVTAWNAARKEVSCKPCVKEILRTDEGGETLDTLPDLRGVPVLYLFAGGGGLTFDVPVGSTVLVFVSRTDWSTWYESGGRLDTPGPSEGHALSTALALPCGGPLGARPPVAPGGVTLSGASILLGSISATLGAAVGEYVDARLETFRATFNAHTHPAPGGATSPPLTPQTPFDSTKSTKVKLLP